VDSSVVRDNRQVKNNSCKFIGVVEEVGVKVLSKD
jgi:hypothetical protein